MRSAGSLPARHTHHLSPAVIVWDFLEGPGRAVAIWAGLGVTIWHQVARTREQSGQGALVVDVEADAVRGEARPEEFGTRGAEFTAEGRGPIRMIWVSPAAPVEP